MSKSFEARRTHGSFADLSGGKAKPIVGQCLTCGAKLIKRGKKYCLPCYDVRLAENIAKNKARYKAQRIAAKSGAST